MKGHLRIVCARNALGANHLKEQSFRAPLHLSKAHEDADALVLNLVNPTAGIFDDDEIEISATVERGSALVLTTPSSNRIYRSRARGATARVRQTFTVQEDAFLEFFPEPFIPHAGARYHQRNELRIAAGGTLIYFEWLTPGRVASGEVFLFDDLQWDTDLWAEDKLVVRERFHLSPADQSLKPLQLLSPEAHYLGCFVITEAPPPTEAVHAMEDKSLHIGCGPLSTGGWVIKALCADALTARRTLNTLRGLIYDTLKRPLPWLGRY